MTFLNVLHDPYTVHFTSYNLWNLRKVNHYESFNKFDWKLRKVNHYESFDKFDMLVQ